MDAALAQGIVASLSRKCALPPEGDERMSNEDEKEVTMKQSGDCKEATASHPLTTRVRKGLTPHLTQ